MITAWLIFVHFMTEKGQSNSTKFNYGFGGFKAITTCCSEHDIYILCQNALCQKSNILCKSSNILCQPYLPMFAPENSLLWRCIALLPGTSPDLPSHPAYLFANPPCPSQPTQLVLCSLLPGSASLACPAWPPTPCPTRTEALVEAISKKPQVPMEAWSNIGTWFKAGYCPSRL